jgi:hypothetical protein
MTACATRATRAKGATVNNLFLPVPDTDFRDYLDEADQLARFAPEIIAAIEKDLDAAARERKLLRMADRRFLDSRTANLPQMDVHERDVLAAELRLAVGRPRMSGYAVYVFLMVRGFIGSLTGRAAQRFLRESISLYAFLQDRGLSMPAPTTILENVNVVSHATRELIFDRQIAMILNLGLDDFKHLTLDSTAVKANSAWPTDAKILTGLLMRAARLGQKLAVFAVENFRSGWVPRWLEEMDKGVFQISLVAGKARSKGKLKKHYRQLLARGRKAADALAVELKRLEQRRPWRDKRPVAGHSWNESLTRSATILPMPTASWPTPMRASSTTRSCLRPRRS